MITGFWASYEVRQNVNVCPWKPITINRKGLENRPKAWGRPAVTGPVG